MAVPFTIRVTKEILDRAKYCGQKQEESIGENCAIALALRDLFPDVSVTGTGIHPFGSERNLKGDLSISLPFVARDFIKVFDSLVAMPRVRLLLPEFDFEIMIPDKVLEQINIEGLQDLAAVQVA